MLTSLLLPAASVMLKFLFKQNNFTALSRWDGQASGGRTEVKMKGPKIPHHKSLYCRGAGEVVYDHLCTLAGGWPCMAAG